MKAQIITIFLIIGLVSAFVLSGCAATERVTSQSGAELWSNNCLRCHNAPDPADYSDAEWEVIGDHMRSRTNALTDEERDKIVAFMKSAD